MNNDKVHLSDNDLKALIAKFDVTGSLNIQSGRGQNPYRLIKKITMVIFSTSQNYIAISISAHEVALIFGYVLYNRMQSATKDYPFLSVHDQPSTTVAYIDHGKRFTEIVLYTVNFIVPILSQQFS